ncbi:MAG: UDP-N-acetylglucosamine 1-carboxyvinyltransferase [Rhodospirillales bacterium]
MDRIGIRGGRPLRGEITISGAKNAALPLMAAALLTEEGLTLENVPALMDIASMSALLKQLGVVRLNRPDVEGMACVTLTAAEIADTCAPYDLVRKMRASILVLGPLLAREGVASVSMPGGCAIGTRPVDLHLMGFEAMGATIDLRDGYIHAKAAQGLRGAEIVFPKVSVGATENIMMAAALARGTTRLVNAACEPEIVDLGRCLQAMGARIEGLGGEVIEIEGVARLKAATHRVVADRIETGTYAMAAAMTGGEIELLGGQVEHLSVAADLLARSGVELTQSNRGLTAKRANGRLIGSDAQTAPFPGFPTDLQAQFMALMTTAEGASMITETIFENRFMHVPELMRMGADITVHDSSAIVRGRERLTGAPVMATDLRASVSLVLAGLAAEGDTTINRVYHLDRGYERVEAKLAACGAEIERLPGSD